MKTLIPALILMSALVQCLAASLAKAQGVIDLASPAASPTPSSYPSPIVGVAVREPWSTVQPHCDSFSWGDLGAGIKSAHAHGLVVILNVDTAPLIGGPMPDWVCSPSGNTVTYSNGTYTCTATAPACNTFQLETVDQGSITIAPFWNTQYLTAKHYMLQELYDYLTSNYDGSNTLLDEVRFIRSQYAGAATEDWNVPHGSVNGEDNNNAWCMNGYSSNKLVSTCESELDFVEQLFGKQVIQGIGDNGGLQGGNLESLDPSDQYSACTTNGRSSSDCCMLDSCYNGQSGTTCPSNPGPNCVSLALLEYANSNYPNFFVPEKDDLHYTSSTAHTPVYDASGTYDGWETLGCELSNNTITNVWEQDATAQGSACDLCQAAGLGESYGPTHIEIYTSDLNNYPNISQGVQTCLKNGGTRSDCMCDAKTSCTLTDIQTAYYNKYGITCN